MAIRVELFGVARFKAGVALTTVEGATLGCALKRLVEGFPTLAECIDGDALRSGFAANVNGDRFVVDPATPLAEGDSLLILSADAGG